MIVNSLWLKKYIKTSASFKKLFSCFFYTVNQNLLHQKALKLLSSFRTLHFREKPICREQMDFFWQTFQLHCVGLRQAALNNLKLLRKNSQLCPV